VIEFIAYLGWIKVAETLLYPWGDDDEDFQVNYVIDRNFQVITITTYFNFEHPCEMYVETRIILDSGKENFRMKSINSLLVHSSPFIISSQSVKIFFPAFHIFQMTYNSFLNFSNKNYL
jgi:hypothetical protein